jgi:hypothetical protein
VVVDGGGFPPFVPPRFGGKTSAIGIDSSIIWREEIGNRNRLLFAPHKSMMIMIDHDLS